MIKIVNGTVPSALFKLGYDNAEVDAIVSYIDATGTIEGAPAIKDEHLACFDCSFKPAKGTRTIQYMGHIKMMGATQPFLSGAISKTVNLPNDCSVEDIAEAYTESWRQGLKAVAIYRDGSKGTQPLNVSSDHEKKAAKPVLPGEVQVASAEEVKIAALEAQIVALSATLNANADAHGATAPPRAVRHRLPEERASVTHKFSLSGHEGYITVGLYPNGQPGEIFIRMAKEGSTISGLMDSFATAISIALQHGVPMKVLVEKFAHTRFEPSGWTGNEQIGYAKSIMDYIFRWLQLRFLSGHQLDLFAGLSAAAGTGRVAEIAASSEAPVADYSREMQGTTKPPQQGIAPEVRATSSQETPSADPLSAEDRGIYHVSDAMKEMFNMGDAPSCATCGAIMTRNGSCYRCMSCGSTSGCS
jgi:ribonucleoside-diphosphate reductase alpha chain